MGDRVEPGTTSQFVPARLQRALVLTRVLDVLAATLLLAVLAVPLAFVSAAILFSMGRPVLFTQKRIGQNEELFTLLKFRSMSVSDSDVLSQADDHERLTRFGGWLRRTSIDELPQLVNILVGDMSLVGPRPLLPRYLPYFTDRERLRFGVRPGLTGTAQLDARARLRDADEIGSAWNRKLELDVRYVEQYSVARYLGVLARTVKMLLTTRQPALNWEREAPLDEERDANN